jgi:putative aldouronate transport system permease protein
VGHWNAWFNAMIYLQNRGKYPLSLFLREILIANSTSGNVIPDEDVFFLDEVIKYATIIVSTLPILAAYPFAQRYFMTGVMLGSLKE